MAQIRLTTPLSQLIGEASLAQTQLKRIYLNQRDWERGLQVCPFAVWRIRVLLLSAGRQVYMGHRSDCVRYFESKGFVFPSHCNPADIIMDIISGHGREYNHSAPPEPAELSALLIRGWEAIQLNSASSRSQNAPDRSENAKFLSDLADYDNSRGAPWYLQMFLCFLRGIRQQARQTTSFILEISVGSIAGLLIGLSVYNIEGLLLQGVFLYPFELLSSAANYTLVPELGLLCSLRNLEPICVFIDSYSSGCQILKIVITSSKTGLEKSMIATTNECDNLDDMIDQRKRKDRHRDR